MKMKMENRDAKDDERGGGRISAERFGFRSALFLLFCPRFLLYQYPLTVNRFYKFFFFFFPLLVIDCWMPGYMTSAIIFFHEKSFSSIYGRIFPSEHQLCMLRQGCRFFLI